MVFDKQLFESKYVEPDKRVHVDTLFLIGNGFDIWQGLDTRYAAFEKYYEEHLDEVLTRLHLKKRILTDKKGNPVACSDVELFYGDPCNPQKLMKHFGVKEVNEYHIHETAYILCTACRENPEGD